MFYHLQGNGTESDCGPNVDNTSSAESFGLGPVFVIPELIVTFFVSFGNILVLMAVWKFEELQTCTNMFVVNLATADLCTGLFAIPLHVFIYIFPVLKSDFVICMLRYSILQVSYFASVLTLAVISVDRYISIEKPFKFSYATWVTTTRAKSLCGSIWFVSLTFAALPLMGWNLWTPCTVCTVTVVLPQLYLIAISSCLLVCTFMIGALNLKIFRTANAISREISRQIVSISDHSNDGKYRHLFIENEKAAKTLFLVSGVFSICVVPFSSFMLWETIALDNDTRERYNAVRLVFSSMALCNSCMNPVIYHNKMPEFRKAFRKMLRLKAAVQQMSAADSDNTGER